MRAQWRVLATYPDFRRLFAGSAVSLVGSSVTTVALPLTAVAFLNASPVQMGLLGAAALLPHLILGLPAGVWVERLSYRRMLVITDLIQAVLIGAVPILALLGQLQMWQLYLVALGAGTCALFVAIAAQSFTPTLIPRRDLLAANSTLALSNSIVSTSGSALGGALVQLLTAPIAIAVDAFSFLISAFWKSRIKISGRTDTETGKPRRRLARDVLEGLRIVVGQPVLRAVTIAATIGALAGQLQAVVLILFLVRDLGLSAALVGIAVALTGVAGIVGAVLGVPITNRLGNGPAFIVGMLLSSIAGLVLATAGGPMPLAIAVVIIGQLLHGWGPSLYGINQQTIRQVYVEPEVLPRAQATWRFLVYGMQPIGALLGGGLGATVGLRGTLVIGSVIMLIGTAAALASPLRSLRRLPHAAT